MQMEDEDSILPRKLQAALEHILEQRNELASDKEEGSVNGKQGKARRCSGQTTSLPALFVHSCHFSEEATFMLSLAPQKLEVGQDVA